MTVEGPTRLRVMADYFAFPVWDDGGEIDVGEWPISPGLRAALAAWNDAFESTYPHGWASAEIHADWARTGGRLADALRDELEVARRNVVIEYSHVAEQ